MIEDQVRNHDLDGFMWCNERNSPLDTLIQGGAPGDFSTHSRREAAERGVNVEACRQALLRLYDFMQEAAAGKTFHDGSLITFLRTLLDNPEALVWEKFWLERNKDLDRELYGLVKWCKPNAALRAEHLEPQPLQPDPARAMAMGRANALRRFRQADHLSASGRRGLGESELSILPQNRPARLRPRTRRPQPCSESSASTRPPSTRSSAQAWTRTPTSSANAPTRCAASRARPRSTWASASTRPAPGPTPRR
jgi:hypothetical protein